MRVLRPCQGFDVAGAKEGAKRCAVLRGIAVGRASMGLGIAIESRGFRTIFEVQSLDLKGVLCTGRAHRFRRQV